jgi:hypothetical protein
MIIFWILTIFCAKGRNMCGKMSNFAPEKEKLLNSNS